MMLGLLLTACTTRELTSAKVLQVKVQNSELATISDVLAWVDNGKLLITGKVRSSTSSRNLPYGHVHIEVRSQTGKVYYQGVHRYHRHSIKTNHSHFHFKINKGIAIGSQIIVKHHDHRKPH
jgi:hypothetical protein